MAFCTVQQCLDVSPLLDVLQSHDQLVFLLHLRVVVVVAELVQCGVEEVAAWVVAISCHLQPAQDDPAVGKG